MSVSQKQPRRVRAGHEVLTHWLALNGYFVAISQFSVLSAPDIAAIRLCGLWAKVHVKSKDVYFQKTGEHRQGLDATDFDRCVAIESKLGVPGHIAFLVLAPEPIKVRMASLRLLDQHKRPGIGNRMLYWPIDLFETHEIVDDELIRVCPGAQPAKAEHPWERQAPMRNDVQEYFNFE